MTSEIKKLKTIIETSDNIVFFGGAGVSTESGIPDFRSADGLYNEAYKYPPEKMLSRSFFMEHTEEFYKFYKEKMLYPDAKPNKAHIALAELEKKGKLKAVITQNVDGLHTKAGSVNVLELHGSALRNICLNCKKCYPVEKIIQSEGIPFCNCGGIIKPDVVLYEESLNADIMLGAANAIYAAEVLIVGGTSLNVYPAAGMITGYRGKKLVLINKTETAYDRRAALIIRESIAEALDMSVRG
ncbi:MAG: NAD-dependent protein deacylase [Oscillospiraceae bacterium]|nr:NAD-dependent protein deacylase [Oscillospiraceae bacterium]MCL2279792.1 NAD-dependent protein deacylase [Oscillospiraceae bacterium]